MRQVGRRSYRYLGESLPQCNLVSGLATSYSPGPLAPPRYSSRPRLSLGDTAPRSTAGERTISQSISLDSGGACVCVLPREQ